MGNDRIKNTKRREFLLGFLVSPVLTSLNATALGKGERYVLLSTYSAPEKMILDQYLQLANDSNIPSMKKKWIEDYGLIQSHEKSFDGKEFRSVLIFKNESDVYKFLHEASKPGVFGANARDSLGVNRKYEVLSEGEYFKFITNAKV